MNYLEKSTNKVRLMKIFLGIGLHMSRTNPPHNHISTMLIDI